MPTTEKIRQAASRRRLRMALVVSGVAGWVALVSTLHVKEVWTGGTTKGAAELLQIGALPVT